MSTEKFEDFNIDDLFKEVTSSGNLGEGVHDNVRLISIDISKRKDKNNKPLKMQLFLKFKKYDKDNNDIGEKEISFFMLDAAKNTVISNLITYLVQVKSILAIYCTEEAILAFDPLNALIEATADEDVKDEDLQEDVIRKTYLKKSSGFKVIEEAIKNQFFALLEDKIGTDSDFIRLKLEESRDGKYIQIPHFNQFVEKMEVKKIDSLLYN